MLLHRQISLLIVCLLLLYNWYVLIFRMKPECFLLIKALFSCSSYAAFPPDPHQKSESRVAYLQLSKLTRRSPPQQGEEEKGKVGAALGRAAFKIKCAGELCFVRAPVNTGDAISSGLSKAGRWLSKQSKAFVSVLLGDLVVILLFDTKMPYFANRRSKNRRDAREPTRNGDCRSRAAVGPRKPWGNEVNW